jgi:hypothetical protein
MHLKVHRRHKDGKEHRYFSIVESRRVSRQRVAHRTVVYLGEINDTQQAAWRKTLEVFDENQQNLTTLSLFPDDRAVAAIDVDTVQVKLNQMRLERPRAFGGCWLGCELWRQLKLDELWEARLGEGAGSRALGEGAAPAGGEPAAGSRQRVSRASAVV